MATRGLIPNDESGVVPALAGTQRVRELAATPLDSGFRRNDEEDFGFRLSPE
jgi:hypothetical protein